MAWSGKKSFYGLLPAPILDPLFRHKMGKKITSDVHVSSLGMRLSEAGEKAFGLGSPLTSWF